MKWFRMYDEIMDDPKLSDYSDKEKWVLVQIFCAVNRSAERGKWCYSVSKLARFIHQKESFLSAFISKIFQDGIIKWNGQEQGSFFVTNWNKRQYESDDVAKRVRKHREMKRFGNVTETPSDTDTDTESDTDKKKNLKRKKVDWAAKKISIQESIRAAWKENENFYKEKYPGVDFELEQKKQLDWVMRKPRDAAKHTDWNLFIQTWLAKAPVNYLKAKQQKALFTQENRDRPGEWGPGIKVIRSGPGYEEE